MKLRYTLIAAAISASFLASCSSSDKPIVSDGGDSSNRSRLKKFDNSSAFYEALRLGLIANSTNDYRISTEGSTDAVNSAAPTAGDSDAGSSESGSSGAEVTSTNVQVAGVDEQDWVKVTSDGSNLFVLINSFSDLSYSVGPQSGSGSANGVSSADPDDASPGDNDIAEGNSIDGPDDSSQSTTLRIMSLDADSPDATSLKELDIDLNGRNAAGLYLYENGSNASVFITSTGGGYWANWAEPTLFSGLSSTITRVDVSNPVQASISDSFTIDGQIISSRRIGNHLFFASRYYPTIPGEQPWRQSSEEWERTVNSTDLTSVLPQYKRDGSTETTPLVVPENCFVTSSNNDDSYYSPDIITLGVIDLDNMQLSDSECFLGATESLYASTESVFLATTRYDYSQGPTSTDGGFIDVEDGEFPAADEWFDPRADTDIHQFDISSGQLNYVASGSAKGHFGWNALRKPFRMSQKDGYLRVATFNDRQGVNSSPILLTILKPDGNGKLETISTLPNEDEPSFIGKPGEQLYASRFLGDRAYLVTFRQTDPLYILDLANPSEPKVAGELSIEGYSEYLHPIGNDYLLGIGKDAVATSDGQGDGRGALVQGVKLSLFNVSDASSPTEIQSVIIGQRGTHSEALSDHRAITVQASTDQHPTRVSFGVDVYGQINGARPSNADNARDNYDWTSSGLHAFDIKTGTDAGIVSRGALIVAQPSGGNQWPYSRNYTGERAVMVNDSVFYIRDGSVYAAPWDDLATPTPAR